MIVDGVPYTQNPFDLKVVPTQADLFLSAITEGFSHEQVTGGIIYHKNQEI